MPNQVEYYNHFGESYKTSILSCPEPELWTTDYDEKGRIYQEMVQRIKHQTSLVEEFFSKDHSVVDAGCGFGRQAIILARRGFSIVGADSSRVLVEIARELFTRHHLNGKFYDGDLIQLSLDPFSQLILFDVVEHIRPSARRILMKRLHSLSRQDAVLLLSVPHLGERFTSKVNNTVRKKITQNFSYFLAREEHPYPIPTQKEITRLIRGLFTTLKFEQTAPTDYYVLRKL
jgi:2-polyprenyl-3-methyl-5-hydroxy-6-metoxy-1,4-benzoquinol methylase